MGSSTSSLVTVNEVDLQPKRINSSVFELCKPQDAKLEIIFVHDIHWEKSGDSHLTTWESRSTPPVCWPKEWLFRKFPEARISCLRYDGGAWKTDNEGRMDLYTVGENLVQDVITSYAKVPNFQSRWICLIGHGLGGLVIKQMIHKAAERREQLIMKENSSRGFSDEANLTVETCRLHYFLKNIRGIFSYAPLCLGSELVHSIRHGPEKLRGDLQRSLQCLNKENCRLNEWFRSWRQSNDCRTFSIYAGHPTSMRTWYGFDITLQVTSEAAARFDIDSVYSVMENHFNVCKPQTQSDSSFVRLQDFLQDIIDDSRLSNPVAPNHDQRIDDETWCTERVQHILNRVRESNGPPLSFGISLEDLEKIRTFQYLYVKLSEGLTNLGLERTGCDATCEYYESTE